MHRRRPTSPASLRTTDLVLNPATRVLWRNAASVQLELGGRRVVVDGVDRATVRSLLRRPLALPSAEATVRSFDAAALDTLVKAGFVWPAMPGSAALPPPHTARLGTDLSGLAARFGADAPRVLTARRDRSVAIAGRGRAAVSVATLLAASGVGRVYFVDSGDVHLSHTLPGGLDPDAEGERFAVRAVAAVRAAAPEVDTVPVPGEQPDLTVLAVDEPVDSDQRDSLHDRDCAHLVVALGAGAGVVGPLVVPGLTSCLHCADLHRRDRDPAWTELAVQLTIAPAHGAASEAPVAAMLAAVAALQGLAFLDTGRAAAIDGTLELHPPDWRLRRRTWPAHSECGCGAKAADGQRET